ncbi:MAG: sigma-70 family RNA polymerase sigma factor [Candidatus Gastranaerophilales bacterium]|nr:sigma-70 family RNA polymerase sigma factor [Candidatus Gastranaerophilales bacterium]
MSKSESSEKPTVKSLSDYTDLIETVARIEYNRLSGSNHLVDYSELVNIGAFAVHIILTTNKESDFNISYMSTAIRWAIRNELRRRYKWYSFKHKVTKEEAEEILDNSEKTININQEYVREAIYEAILSIDEMADPDNLTQIKDKSITPDEILEFGELSKAIKEAIKKLPAREKAILESRFYKNKKIREIASDLKISTSRVSRVLQTGLDKVKIELQKQELV